MSSNGRSAVEWESNEVKWQSIPGQIVVVTTDLYRLLTLRSPTNVADTNKRRRH